MPLLLVQHGEATPKTEDPTRPLTARGADDVEAMAIFAARHGVRVNQIRHSGKLRAKQTAEILAEPLHPERGVVAVTGINPDDDVQPVAEAIAREKDTVMIVGHLPFLSRLAGHLLVGDAEAAPVRFHNGGIVCLASEGDRWFLDWAMSPSVIK